MLKNAASAHFLTVNAFPALLHHPVKPYPRAKKDPKQETRTCRSFSKPYKSPSQHPCLGIVFAASFALGSSKDLATITV